MCRLFYVRRFISSGPNRQTSSAVGGYSGDVNTALRFTIVNKFINLLMRDGKRTKAQSVFLKSLKILESKYGVLHPLRLFFYVLWTKRPLISLDSVSRGAQSYMVPYPLTRRRSVVQSLHWLADIARSQPTYVYPRKARGYGQGAQKHGRDSRSSSERLADAVYLACQEKGPFINRRNDLYKIARQGVAHTDYRWR